MRALFCRNRVVKFLANIRLPGKKPVLKSRLSLVTFAA